MTLTSILSVDPNEPILLGIGLLALTAFLPAFISVPKFLLDLIWWVGMGFFVFGIVLYVISSIQSQLQEYSQPRRKHAK